LSTVTNVSLDGMRYSRKMGDGLLYAQDCFFEQGGVSRRAQIPGIRRTPSNTTYGVVNAAGFIDNVIAAREQDATYGRWVFCDLENGSFSEYTARYPLAGDGSTQVGVYTDYPNPSGTNAKYSRGIRIGGDVVFANEPVQRVGAAANGSMMIWGGSTKTSTLNSTTSTRTASTTSGSDVVTFSGAVTGLDATWEKCYIYLSGISTRPFRVIRYISTTQVQIDTVVSTTAAAQTWCIQPVAWVGAPSSIFYTNAGVSMNEVTTNVSAAHQGRLFTAFQHPDQWSPDTAHKVYYSGTLLDTVTNHRGIHYWNSGSYFSVAPEIGSQVTSLVSHDGDLYIFKDVGIAIMRGVVANGDPAKFGARVDVISSNLGCLGHDQAVSTPRGIVFHFEDRFYLLNRDGITAIDDDIRGFLMENARKYSQGRSLFTIGSSVYCTLDTTIDTTLDINDGSYEWYLVWDAETGLWSTRLFKRGCNPFYSVTHTTNDITMTTCVPLNHDGTYASWFHYYGDIEKDPQPARVYSSTSFTAYNIDNPMFLVITNGMVAESEYPGYTRIPSYYLLASTNPSSAVTYPTSTSIVSSAYASISTMLADRITSGTLVGGSTMADVDYDLPDTNDELRWLRFNSGAMPAALTQHIVIGDSAANGDNNSVRILGIRAEVASSAVVES